MSPPPAIADAVLSAFAERLNDDGPLQSELLLSYLLGMAWAGSEWGRTEAAEALAEEVMRAPLRGHPAGGLALQTIARTGPASARQKARLLLESGRSAGATGWRLPEWADRIGTAELGRSAIATDVYGDQTSYYLGFSYPGVDRPEPHVLVVLVDYNLHLIKDMFVRVGSGFFELLEEIQGQDDGSTLGPMDPQAASDDLWRHLDVTDRTIGEVFGEESGETRYLLAARLDRLPPPRRDVDDVPEVTVAERDRIVSAFMRTKAVKELLSGEGVPDAPPGRDGVRYIARVALDYACDYGVGDPLRWSPMAAELFLTDWAPRKVHWEAEDIPWVPEVLDALVGYCGAKKGLDTRWIEETRAAVEEFGGDFLMLELQGSSKGPAGQIFASMLADGVDVTDDDAVQRWIARYNSLR
ncbi:MAG: hypothetical protein R2737_18480 [Candidatus Nanopelagicales bacterium]